MKKSTETLIKAGLATYYTGAVICLIGMVKFGIDAAVENHQAKKAAKEKAAAE